MRDLLKFITCGSVDDGKSTLIGHILYDSKLLYADQERALALESKVGSRNGEIDYSLLLDGLTEEREQGITIDVAYRYFTTDERSFIVADTPGHEEYTRNMAVGASFADLSIILIDATKGVLVQTRRHARICSVMGIRHFVFAVNKMDLVAYDRERFEAIRKDIEELSKELGLKNIKVIPVSATEGDNVAKKTDTMKWYEEESLLSYLEHVDIEDTSEEGFYLPVQRVCRPDHTFRGFQGQIESGDVSVGDTIEVLPNEETAKIKAIYIGDRKSDRACAGQAVTLQLDREIDVSRGSVIYKDTAIGTADSITATLLWMDDEDLTAGRNYFVKVGSSLIPGIVKEILYMIDINTGEHKETDKLQKNGIAVCRIDLTDRITVSRFKTHKTLGELILIDRVSFMTSACGVIEEYDRNGRKDNTHITAETRSAYLGQQAVAVLFKEEDGIRLSDLEEAERQLIRSGRHTYLLKTDEKLRGEILSEVLRHLMAAGLVVLVLLQDEEDIVNRAEDQSVIIYPEKSHAAEDIVSYIKERSSI